MHKKIRVVFDMDDILWDLNRVATNMVKIPYDKIIIFHVSENPLLTEEQKKALKQSYSSDELFDNLVWYEGAEKIFTLESKDVEVSINSNCLGANVVERKYKLLHNLYAVDDSRLILNDLTKGVAKEIGDDVTIFVDDSPYNHVMNKAKYHIMMNKPWNTSDMGRAVLGDLDKDMIRCENLIEIIEKVKELIKIKLQED